MCTGNNLILLCLPRRAASLTSMCTLGKNCSVPKMQKKIKTKKKVPTPSTKAEEAEDGVIHVGRVP